MQQFVHIVYICAICTISWVFHTVHNACYRYNMLKAGFKAQRLAPTIPRSTSPWVSTLGGPFYPPPFLVSVSAMQLTSSQDTVVCSTLGSGQLWDLGWNTASVWILSSCQNLVCLSGFLETEPVGKQGLTGWWPSLAGMYVCIGLSLIKPNMSDILHDFLFCVWSILCISLTSTYMTGWAP